MLRCSQCGKFIGYNDHGAVCYIPFGGYEDFEPPDQQDICGKCWAGFSEDRKELTKRIAWMPVQKLF